ncbi:uroporphyrinogen-III synthase [Cladophialophora carrionii]|uniref:Uroporphyrinogen-III synthase n=1 Tax=Cladophialophora carrionii TaxID=86049 RepID=A0A1C1CHC6_9EURO|nr:uroporphyrinogen-III synthase [Cladophialophora carrionii]
MATPPPSPTTIPVLLLKTRSQPHDAYEEYFSDFRRGGGGGNATNNGAEATPLVFLPEFVPVLEHRPNSENLARLVKLLSEGRLSEQYGGMIFTSQRAVEAWADVVKRVEGETQTDTDTDTDTSTGTETQPPQTSAATSQDTTTGSGVADDDTGPRDSKETGAGAGETGESAPRPLIDDDFMFPLYTVGPATSRALNSLIVESAATVPSSQFARLRPAVFGEHTGNGDKLAQYILSHYNTLHSHRVYTFYEAPRLPFTPLLGSARGERVDKDDARLRKKPLLFLVGEQRRDIIPKTLTDKDGRLPSAERIPVDELEVYITAVVESVEDDLRDRLSSFFDAAGRNVPLVVVVVVFSPQGCESMLRALGFLDDDKNLTPLASRRWTGEQSDDPTSKDSARSESQHRRYIVVTIGPTTRDHLKARYGFDADVCAAKPSPEGVGAGLVEFLTQHHIL